MGPILQVKNLSMSYRLAKGWVRAVDNISFDLDHGESLGLVGESGCGKTSVALAIMRLLPPNAKILDGQVIFDETIDLTKIPWDQMRTILWKRISMVFQGAMNALNPVLKVGDQLIEALVAHEDISKSEAKRRVSDMFEVVGIPPPRMNEYPHEFSGGMRQRAIIAMGLICNPDLLFADEPTTALDVVVQDQILESITGLQRKLNVAMIMISHDISIICECCNRIAILYAGQVVEIADARTIFENPRHPYTMALLSAFPSIRGRKKRLVSLPGAPPSMIEPPSGCRFRPRCP
jgi:peptide/nickel transport system ATP-binding protein